MNNHVVLPAVLVDDLTSALLATAAQLEHFAGPDISAVNQSVIDKATDALEATRHHLNHPDNAGDRLRHATRLMQSTRPRELAALDNRECFELAERCAWWKDAAEGRLTAPSLRKLADQVRPTGERIIQTIRDAGAEDDQAVIDTLEDGEALQALGIDDQDAVEDAHASLQATAAERFAAELGNDGTRFEAESGKDFDELLDAHEAKSIYSRRTFRENEELDEPPYIYEAGTRAEYITGDPIRHVFADGSAVVEAGDAWDIEGAEPFSWEGNSQPTAKRLADAIEVELRARGLRHYVGGIEPNHATAGEVILWPYGRPVASVRDAIEFVTEAARS